MRDEQPEQPGASVRVRVFDGPLDGAVIAWTGPSEALAVVAYQDQGVYLPRWSTGDELILVWVPEA